MSPANGAMITSRSPRFHPSSQCFARDCAVPVSITALESNRSPCYPAARMEPMPTAEWCEQHFDYLSPDVARHLHETLAVMRDRCPVAHSDHYDGYWIVTQYEDVLRVAQDWQTFSSAHGVSVPDTNMVVKAIPEH